MPVSQYSVMLSRMWSRVRLPEGRPSTKARGDLVVGVRVVVDHPGREGDRRVEQGVADRLRPGGHLDEVAVSGLLEGGDLRGRGALLVGVRRHGPLKRRHEQVRVDADQALGLPGVPSRR